MVVRAEAGVGVGSSGRASSAKVRRGRRGKPGLLLLLAEVAAIAMVVKVRATVVRVVVSVAVVRAARLAGEGVRCQQRTQQRLRLCWRLMRGWRACAWAAGEEGGRGAVLSRTLLQHPSRRG